MIPLHKVSEFKRVGSLTLQRLPQVTETMMQMIVSRVVIIAVNALWIDYRQWKIPLQRPRGLDRVAYDWPVWCRNELVPLHLSNGTSPVEREMVKLVKSSWDRRRRGKVARWGSGSRRRELYSGICVTKVSQWPTVNDLVQCGVTHELLVATEVYLLTHLQDIENDMHIVRPFWFFVALCTSSCCASTRRVY